MANLTTIYYSQTMILLVLVSLCSAVKHRVPTAVYLLIGQAAALSGSTVFFAQIHATFETSEWSLWAFHCGILVEGLLLSLALAARTRLSQQAAIMNLKKYEIIYNSSVEGRFQFDFSSNRLKCNEALVQMFGYETKEELGDNTNLLDYFTKESHEDLTRQLVTYGVVKDYEVQIYGPKVGSIWASLTMKLHSDAEGGLGTSEGTLIDISERKLKEDAEKDKAVAEAKTRARTQFFASMSHEFRTPLTSILGYLEIALDNTLSDKERIAHVATIESSAKHLLHLVNDTLDLSKIEAQKLVVENIEVNLVDLLEELQDVIKILAEKKGLDFLMEYRFPLPAQFLSDPLRLKQALLNLCSNSVKFTHEGHVKVLVHCNREEEQLFFAVEDTGIGLKSEQQVKLFNAFEQADNSTSRNFGGTGLGLHLSQQISHKLDGDIAVESEYGRGSTFTLHGGTGKLSSTNWLESDEQMQFDLVKPSKCKAPVKDSPQSVMKDKLKVLLADDNEVNQQLLIFHLKRAGAEVVSAHDGYEAIGECYQQEFDLILMDMDMPTIDGPTAVRCIREKGVNTLIYALTANVGEESIKECLAAGYDGHLAKPIDTEQLMIVMESVKTRLNAMLG